MNDRGAGSILGRLAYSIGYALGRADSLIEAGTSALADFAPTSSETYPGDSENDHPGWEGTTSETTSPGETYPGHTAPHDAYTDLDDYAEDDGIRAGAALSTLAAGWALSRLVRPHPINWPRAILAGAAATALADLVGSIGRGSDRRTPFPPTAEDLPRYAAGIATAAAYAAQIYPRLPGSPLTRGLIFGAVEAAVRENGGTIGMIQRYAPQLRLPLASLANYAAPRRSALASLAFGVGLALYADKGKEKKAKAHGKRR